MDADQDIEWGEIASKIDALTETYTERIVAQATRISRFLLFMEAAGIVENFNEWERASFPDDFKEEQ